MQQKSSVNTVYQRLRSRRTRYQINHTVAEINKKIAITGIVVRRSSNIEAFAIHKRRVNCDEKTHRWI